MANGEKQYRYKGSQIRTYSQLLEAAQQAGLSSVEEYLEKYPGWEEYIPEGEKDTRDPDVIAGDELESLLLEGKEDPGNEWWNTSNDPDTQDLLYNPDQFSENRNSLKLETPPLMTAESTGVAGIPTDFDFELEKRLDIKNNYSKLAQESYLNNKQKNPELFYSPGDISLTSEGQYLGNVLNWDKVDEQGNFTEVEQFNDIVLNDFVQNDKILNEKIIPFVLQEKSQELNRLADELNKKYNLGDADREDFNEDLESAEKEWNEILGEFVYNDERVQKHLNNFGQAYEEINSKMWSQFVVGKEMNRDGETLKLPGLGDWTGPEGIDTGWKAGNTFRSFIRSTQLLQENTNMLPLDPYSMYATFRRWGTSSDKNSLRRKTDYKWGPVQENFNANLYKSEKYNWGDDKQGFIVTGKNMKLKNGMFFPTKKEYDDFFTNKNRGYELTMPNFGQLEKTTWGEAKKILKDKTTAHTKEAIKDYMTIEERQITDGAFDAGSFLAMMNGETGQLQKMIGSQLPELFRAALTLGAAPAVQASGDIYFDRLRTEVQKKHNISDKDFNDPKNRLKIAKLISDYNVTPEARAHSEAANLAAIPYAAAEFVGLIPQFKAIKLFVGKAGGSFIRNQMGRATRGLVQGGYQAGRASFVESITEGIQTAIEDQGRGGWSDLWENMKFENYLEAMGSGAVIGGLMPGSVMVLTQTARELYNANRIIMGKLNLDKTEAFFQRQLNSLDELYKKGSIREDEYIDKKQVLKDLRNANLRLPKELEGKDRLKLVDLVLEKEQLKKKIEGKDEAVVNKEKDRIKELDNEIIILTKFLPETRKITTKAGKALEGTEWGGKYIIGKDAADTKEKAGKNAIALDADATGYISPDGKTIIIDEQKAAKLRQMNTAAHEVLHAALFTTLYEVSKKGKITGKGVVKGLAEQAKALILKAKEKDPNRNSKGYIEFNQRLQKYKNHYGKDKKGEIFTAEETITLLGDALAYKHITFKEGLLTKMADATRRFLQDIGWANIEINDEQDFYKFLKDYNTSIAKGRFTKAQKKMFTKEGIKIGSSIKGAKEGPIPGFSKKSAADINKTYDADTTKEYWKNQGGADLAMADIFPILQKDLSFKAKRFRDLPNFSEEDFIAGTIADLIPHIRNFDPEKAAVEGSKITLSGWINAQIDKKIAGILGRKEATTEKYTEDITEPTVQNKIEEALYEEVKILRESDGNISLLDAGIINDIVNDLVKILEADIAISSKTIYDDVSKNRTVTPYISKIRNELKRHGMAKVKEALGGKANNEFINNMIKYKEAMLSNFTKGYLAKFAPETILKSVGGKWVFEEINGKQQKVFKPNWVDHTVWKGIPAAKIDTQKSSVTGMTDGKQLMKKKPNLKDVISDKEWGDKFKKKFINKKGKEDYTLVQNKTESISEQLAAEGGLDIFYRDIQNPKSKIHSSFLKNAEIKELVLRDNFAVEVGRQIDRGNTKLNIALDSKIPVDNDGDLYIKEYISIAKIIYTDNDTVEDFATDSEWTDKRLKKYSTLWIPHIKELEAKGIPSTGGFYKSMSLGGVDQNTQQDYKNHDQHNADNKLDLHEENKIIAASGIGRIIKEMYTKKDGEISDNIMMLWYISRGLDPGGKKETKASVEARKEIRRKNKTKNYTEEEIAMMKEKGLKELPSPKPDWQKDKFGKNITGPFHDAVQDIKEILYNNNTVLPSEVENALTDMRVWNSKTGRMLAILKDIYSVKGKKAQLAKLKEHQTEINNANIANTVILKYIIEQFKTLNGSLIDQNNTLTLLQEQQNAVLGLKGLTKWEWVTIDGIQRTTKEEIAELYGEHMQPNVSAMGRIAGFVTSAKDQDIDTWYLDDKKGLSEFTQLGTIKRVGQTELDKGELGRTPLKTHVDRINSLKKKDRDNIYHINGNNFRTQRGLDRVQRTKDVNFAKKSLAVDKFKIFDEAMAMSRRNNPKQKGITILDFDDTLAISDSKVIVNLPKQMVGGKQYGYETWHNGKVKMTSNATEKITPAEFAKNSAAFESIGATFDFSEFNKVVKGRKGPLFDLALKRQKKFGSKDIYVLTARPQTSARAIQKFARGLGLYIPIKNITGLENGTSQAKADWVTKKVAEGYNDFYFADDAYKNVKAVQNVLNQFDVKSDVQQAKSKMNLALGDTLGDAFNKVIEGTTGVDAFKKFSDAAAKMRGAEVTDWGLFLPASAEDFKGLIYSFLGKGEAGTKQKKWFEVNLLRPLARGYADINAAKLALENDYKALKKQYPEIHKKLKKDSGYSSFNFGNAIRVYLWDKHGMEIPGISKRDLKALNKIVKSDPDMKDFADKLSKLTKLKEGYIQPDANWAYGNIGLDLIDINQNVRRGHHLKEFNENADEIFSKENMNKIEAIYGTHFKDALVDMLYRIQNGTNRNFGSNKYVNGAMNWVNNATGTIMFFNTRSAVLQTISFANFVNWTDNNIYKAGVAFANQPQFWKDFSYLFNSDFLKARRAGLQQDVNWQEIASHVKNSKNKVKDAISWLLQKGFLPTKTMDSFAIALGGASMYRNRVNSYIKEGLSEKEAKEKAFVDFQEIAETTQQSGRPDLISQEQASVLGRVILAFQNVTMQYNRQAKKAVLDLYNRRRNTGQTQKQSDLTNVSKIIYYMGVQNVIFNALQNALFATIFIEDEDDERKLDREKRFANGMLDSILRGMGYRMAIIATLKNMVMEYSDQKKKDTYKQDMTQVLIEAINVSPPLGSKARKVYSGLQTMKFNQDEMEMYGPLNPNNPSMEARAQFIEAATNIPSAKLYYKMSQAAQILDGELAGWQRLGILLGWRDWQLGVNTDQEKNNKKKEVKINLKSLKTGKRGLKK
tara:strand:- start:228 stop:8714 length:8487 start_codon:yes stop_codon:yes gene_type:complete